VAPAKKEPPKSEQAEASNAAKPVPEPAAPAEVLDVVSKVAPAEVLDVVSKVAPADVGRKRILPKGRSLVKLRSLKKDVQVIMPEFGICIADLQKVGIARIPKLTLELHVDAAGKVTSAIIVETSQSIPEFEKCILNKARSLSLPEGEPDRVLRLPFAFGE
jgi:hypothetical protein